MSFDRYQKKHQIVSEFSVKCDQIHLGMSCTNHITGFLKGQYLQNDSRDGIDFFCEYKSKEATN